MRGQVLLSDQVLALPGRAVDGRDPVRGRPGLHPAGEPAREPHQVRVVQVIVGAAVQPPGSRPRAPGVRCLPHAMPPLTVAGAVSGSPLVPARWTGPDGRSRTGRIPAGIALAAGRMVRLWVDAAGLPTGPSPSSSALVANQVLAPAGSHRAGDRAVVAGMGGAVGARPATASRLGSGMGCCRPSVDPALVVTGSALTAGRLATSRPAYWGADHRSARPASSAGSEGR
jgi:hypothetical protein